MSQETRSNLTREDIEAAIEAVGYDPLSDHHGFCYVFMDAEEEFGNVAAKFEYGIIGQSQDTLLMRFRETRWFSGVPGELLKACNRWNFEAMFPKACLALDNDGDSLLVLEHCIPLGDHELSSGLLQLLMERFHSAVTHFLAENTDLLSAVVPCQTSLNPTELN